jgi:REP element-mobilizing transposase RayT
MSQSLSLVLVHLVFSTKDRQPFVNESVRAALHAYLAAVARQHKCACFRVGGVSDHVHLAVSLHPTVTVAELVQELKAGSSKWMKTQGVPAFGWQRGYGAFSVGPGDREALIRYIETQETHHRKRTFQDEMRAFFEKYHVAFDERYVWD